MHPKDLAARYEVKVFDSPEAAEKEGFTLGERREARNAWNRDSNASAIMFELLGRKRRGEVSEVALVLDMYGVAPATKNAEEKAEAGD